MPLVLSFMVMLRNGNLVVFYQMCNNHHNFLFCSGEFPQRTPLVIHRRCRNNSQEEEVTEARAAEIVRVSLRNLLGIELGENGEPNPFTMSLDDRKSFIKNVLVSKVRRII